jgi:glycosyltransferase involved in cell wall biosynthesis
MFSATQRLKSDVEGVHGSSEIDVSVVMPCLNERDTLAACIQKAEEGIRTAGVRGEIIVADNGSTDGSQEIARQMGARVLAVRERGYGNALRAGIAAARGKYVVMGDADDSYDFREVGRFYRKLEEGFDLVQGCRLPRGGGTVSPGAMPPLHRWWGNPMFSRIANVWFAAPVNDIYCGLRAFRRDFYHRLGLRCTGMEFATEMIIRSSLSNANIGEIPITLHKDGRTSHAPHLRTFRDGWRTLRFFLLYSPRWLFFFPGLSLIALGAIGYIAVFSSLTLGVMHFDAHTLLFASLFIIMGYQAVIFAVSAWTFATAEGLMPRTARLDRLNVHINLERNIVVGALSLLAGAALLANSLLIWKRAGFGNLDYHSTMRWVIPGVTLTAIGFQTILSSFFLGLLGMRSSTSDTPGYIEAPAVAPAIEH